MAKLHISKRTVDSLEPTGRVQFFWDTELTGFGLKLSEIGRKTYVVQYRAGGGRRGVDRRYTIGSHGAPWTPEQARREARRLLGAAAAGEDPAGEKQHQRRTMTLSELCQAYVRDRAQFKKPSTIATDLGRIERHIKPLLGSRKVTDITRPDVRRFMQDVANGKTAADIKTRPHGRAIVKGGKGTAARTVGLLGAIFTYAVENSFLKENPVRGVKRFPDRKSNRFLSENELSRLGSTLRSFALEGENIYAVEIIRLLALTGARKGEIERLRWEEVDLEFSVLRLKDSKTGQKIIHLSPPAASMLRGIAASQSSFVFPAAIGDGHYQGVAKVWRKVRKAAGLIEVRLHDLRHSFASTAVTHGTSLAVIAALLGHASASTAGRYAHLSDDPVRSASKLIGSKVERALEAWKEVDTSEEAAE